MTIDEHIGKIRYKVDEMDNMEFHEHLDVIQAEFTRLRSRNEVVNFTLDELEKENERLRKENKELRAIIKVLERENKELSQYNKPADRGR